ncbi:MAG: PAS domain-containing protein [Sedimentisphaerales bacterium]|nr:PAS domain-containing protein [Sedimentisphaerales bacterium]
MKEILAMTDFPVCIIFAEDSNRMLRALRSALKGSTGNNVEFRIKPKDGTIIRVVVLWQPIYDNKGKSLGH